MATRKRRTLKILMVVNDTDSRLFSVAGTRIRRKMLVEFVGHPFPLLGVGRGLFLGRDVRPCFGVFRVDRQPLLDAGLGIGLDRVDRAFRLADPAIDAFIGVDDQHIFALVEAIHGADFNAVHVFAFDAIVVDDVGHIHTLNGLFASLAPIAWGMRAQVSRPAAPSQVKSSYSACAVPAGPLRSTKPLTLSTRTLRSSATVMTSPGRTWRLGAAIRAPLTRT